MKNRSIRNASDENDKHIIVSGSVTRRKHRRYCVCIVLGCNRNLKKKKRRTTKNPTLHYGETIKKYASPRTISRGSSLASVYYTFFFPVFRLRVSIIRVGTRVIVIAPGTRKHHRRGRCKIQIFTAPRTCRIRLVGRTFIGFGGMRGITLLRLLLLYLLPRPSPPLRATTTTVVLLQTGTNGIFYRPRPLSKKKHTAQCEKCPGRCVSCVCVCV